MLEMGVIGGDGVVVVDDTTEWRMIPYDVLNRGLRIRGEGRVVEDLLWVQPEKTLQVERWTFRKLVWNWCSLEVNLEERLLGSILEMIWLVVDLLIVVEILTGRLKFEAKNSNTNTSNKTTHPVSISESHYFLPSHIR